MCMGTEISINASKTCKYERRSLHAGLVIFNLLNFVLTNNIWYLICPKIIIRFNTDQNIIFKRFEMKQNRRFFSCIESSSISPGDGRSRQAWHSVYVHVHVVPGPDHVLHHHSLTGQETFQNFTFLITQTSYFRASK